MNYRKDILNLLIPYFEKDDRYYLLICDSGFGGIDQIKKRFPDRVKNMGIQEQNTVSVAQGMAIEGLKPIVFSIMNFLVMRSFEQVRNTAIQNLDVKFIGTGANDYFNFLGKSHTCGEDDIELMKLAKIKVYDPYEMIAEEELNLQLYVDSWIDDEQASYIRV